jgi:hypothetical protein
MPIIVRKIIKPAYSAYDVEVRIHMWIIAYNHYALVSQRNEHVVNYASDDRRMRNYAPYIIPEPMAVIYKIGFNEHLFRRLY